jgi:hypothetical protein
MRAGQGPPCTLPQRRPVVPGGAWVSACLRPPGSPMSVKCRRLDRASRRPTRMLVCPRGSGHLPGWLRYPRRLRLDYGDGGALTASEPEAGDWSGRRGTFTQRVVEDAGPFSLGGGILGSVAWPGLRAPAGISRRGQRDSSRADSVVVSHYTATSITAAARRIVGTRGRSPTPRGRSRATRGWPRCCPPARCRCRPRQ